MSKPTASDTIRASEQAKNEKRESAKSMFLSALEDYIDAKVKAGTEVYSPDDSMAGCFSFSAIEKARTELSKTLDTLMETH